MNTANELPKVIKLLMSINDNFAAYADMEIDWLRREIVVTIDQGGKTLYSASLHIDGALEAKARLIRHELEQMQIAALSQRSECAA